MRKAREKKQLSIVLLTAVCSVWQLAPSQAQMPGAPGQGPAGPIDITADEQEFAGDAVIARGRVKVVYKDSVILSPLATLYKDPAGNPSRAVFTGHPRLTQGSNKIDANTLTFEMAHNKIVADGNAHSEVDVPADEDKEGASPAGKTPETKPVAASDADADSDDEDEAPKPLVSETKENKTEKKETKKAEKIITDSDRQEYDQATGKFDALGHVRVKHGDIVVTADKLQLVYGATNNKPETALFTGNVVATQGKNTTCADNLNYSLSTKRLQATGHVKSKVIQEKNQGGEKKGGPTASLDLFGTAAIATSKSTRSAALSGNASTAAINDANNEGKEKPVWVFSDAQDYSRDNGRVSAHGNVRVVSGDMYGCGPSIVLVKKPDGRADKIVFVGRSQISQPGRRWIADEIVYLVDEHRVIANGNAKAMILQTPGQNGARPGGKLLPEISKPGSGTRLAEQQGNKRISANKIEAPK